LTNAAQPSNTPHTKEKMINYNDDQLNLTQLTWELNDANDKQEYLRAEQIEAAICRLCGWEER
jgi:hypothetical protein